MKITQFTGQYYFLSNFYPTIVKIGKMTFKSSEHAFMSFKSDDPDWKILCQGNLEPRDIKKMGRQVKLVDNWEKIKFKCMKKCLLAKFADPELQAQLLATGDAVLEEGNTWGDKIWGIDLKTGEGENNLGKLLMEVRKEYAE